MRLEPPRLHVAPMQCYTNSHCRVLLRLLAGDSAVLWTEMEKAADLIAHPRRLEHQASEHPLVLQLGGDNPHELSAAAAAAQRHGGFTELNLNAGCPSITTGGADFGASLMQRAAHTRLLLEEMAAASGLPVSVKCRIGVHETLLPDGTVPQDAYERLHAFVDETTRSGAASHVVVHARAAILGGLSPAKNRCVPPLRYNYVRRLADEFPHLRVAINGGLTLDGDWTRVPSFLASELDAVRRIDGVMVGRDALRRPLDLWRWRPGAGLRDTGDEGNTQRPRGTSVASRAAAIESYTRYACRQVAARQATARDVLQPITLVAQQLHEITEAGCSSDAAHAAWGVHENEEKEIFAAVWDGVVAIKAEQRSGQAGGREKGMDSAAEVLRRESGGSQLPTKKLLKLLSQALGKKEAGKIARNRAEAVVF